MSKTFNRNYLYKLWINSILCSSLYGTFAYIIYFKVGHKELDEALGFFLISIIFGAAFSWLIFLVCHFITRNLPHETTSQRKRIRVTICLTAITGMVGSCLFFGINFGEFTIELLVPFCFLLGIITATVITPVEKHKQSNTNKGQDGIE